MKRYDKLIRDKIPEIIEADGKYCKIRVLSEDEFQQCLRAKLLEEVNEFMEFPCIEEIADIMEVLDSLSKCLGSNLATVEKKRKQKHEERGGFEKKLFLEYVQ